MRHLFSFFCDDIRHELLDKTSFIGVYGGKVNVPRIPFKINKLSFYQRWLLENGTYEVSFEIVGPDGSLITPQIKSKAIVGPENQLSHVVFAVEDLDIKLGGRYTWKVSLRLNSEEMKTESTIEFIENPAAFAAVTCSPKTSPTGM